MVTTLCTVGRLYQRSINQALRLQVRNLNLLECQSKVLLQNYGINVQKFVIIENPDDAKDLESRFKVDEYVIKAQILAGGRGLGYFDNGFEGGVHLTKDPNKVLPICEKMVGHKLVTKQTPKDGIVVKKVMIAESVQIVRETYFSIVMDRTHNGPVIIASPSGGTDIENVAKSTPELIKTYPIDIGQVVSIDAKINFDDNAQYRQKAIFHMEDFSETDPSEVIAAENNLNYVRLTGNIGCLVNGAGLAMATMDIIKLHGGEPANFLDVGGGVNEKQVLTAFKILTSDPNVKSVLVNVFGGIVNCAIIATGIVNATKSLELKVPLVVRLEGTNSEEGKRILMSSGLRIEFASDLDEAARKAVSKA
ncbi:hypothetical protein AAG570_009871 [Ranatra chinensis]|uniref:Uncharacterized protein n=1 Tax=Ranatra chinensis TaxID=642074 RepID=A0ABD0ZDM0_9HEMI